MRNLRLLLSCLCGCLFGYIGLSLPAFAQPSAPGEWTWMGGSSTVPRQLGAQPGVYGTLGTAAPGNVPGGREYALSWTDRNGNLWLFGGLLSSTQENYFNDMWKFDPATGQWAWFSGSSTIGSNCSVISTVCARALPRRARFRTDEALIEFTRQARGEVVSVRGCQADFASDWAGRGEAGDT